MDNQIHHALWTSELAPEQWHDWFLKKIEQATVIFDFTEELSDLRGKEIKKDALLEMGKCFNKLAKNLCVGVVW